MNAPLTTDTIETTAPLTLWRVAGAFMHILHALFGAPEDLAARASLSVETHRLLASWLRAGEAMMRRLLLIEAAADAKPNPRPLLPAPRQRQRQPHLFTADAPQLWRVSFSCLANGLKRPRRAGGAAAPDARPLPTGFRSAWPLAERYEALLRVFNNPLAYARRLARRLHAAPHRVRDLLRAPPEAEHRIDQYAALCAAAETAAAQLNSS